MPKFLRSVLQRRFLAKGDRHPAWQPTIIDTDSCFADFVRSFHDGRDLSNFVKNIPDGILNADFYFPGDNVIAELKTLKTDANETSIRVRRVADCYGYFGYSESDFIAWTHGGKPMPPEVADRLRKITSRSIVQAINKANKQIRDSKIILNKPNAKGLILIANDRNFGYEPESMLDVICKAFPKLTDCCADCIVYFSPNVYHDLGDGVAYTIWVPVYNVGSESFADFVNELGEAWGDYTEKLGDPYVKRKSGDDLFDAIATARPISEFRKRY